MKTVLQRPAENKPENILHSGTYVSLGVTSDQNGEPYEGAYRPGTGEVVSAFVENISRNTIILVDQYRPIHKKRNIENIAGLLDTDISPEEAIKKEILEETGYTTDMIRHLVSGPKSAGANNEFIHTYYAQVSKDPGQQQLEPGEKGLIVHEIHNTYRDIERFLGDQQALGKYISPSILGMFSHIQILKSLGEI